MDEIGTLFEHEFASVSDLPDLPYHKKGMKQNRGRLPRHDISSEEVKQLEDDYVSVPEQNKHIYEKRKTKNVHGAEEKSDKVVNLNKLRSEENGFSSEKKMLDIDTIVEDIDEVGASFEQKFTDTFDLPESPFHKEGMKKHRGSLPRNDISPEEVKQLEDEYVSVPEQNKHIYEKRRKKRKTKNTHGAETKSGIVVNKDKLLPAGNVSRKEKKELDIDAAVKYIKERCYVISVGGKHLRAFNGKYHADITDKNAATAFFKEVMHESANRLTRDYIEIQRQLISEPDVAYGSWDEVERNRNVVVFQNGTYDILSGKFLYGQFFPEYHVFSIVNFDYDPNNFAGRAVVDRFVKFFSNNDPDREELLYQIVGYCLSNYENKKACFYFIGEPDAGKSTLCKFLEAAVGGDSYISISMKELNSKFASGDLVGAKVVADEDVALQNPLKSADISLIKKITSSDKIRTEAKFKDGVQIRPECKLVWAGNGMLKFNTSEDLQPFFNRLIIFPLDKAVPEDERDPDIVSKLIKGRNYILYRALNALRGLVADNFRFHRVVATEAYVTTSDYTAGVEAFVESECIFDDEGRAGSSELHKRYEQFCSIHPMYDIQSINPFIRYLRDKYGLRPFRSAAMRGLEGICLRDDAVTQ